MSSGLKSSSSLARARKTNMPDCLMELNSESAEMETFPSGKEVPQSLAFHLSCLFIVVFISRAERMQSYVIIPRKGPGVC